MKQKNKIIIMLFLLSTVLTVSAQNQKADTLNRRFFYVKAREMVGHLKLTKKQQTQFIPIYERYNEEMKSVWNERQSTKRPKTINEAAIVQKSRIRQQQKAQSIQLKYVDELSKILNAEQLNSFFDMEKQLQQKLKARRNRNQK